MYPRDPEAPRETRSFLLAIERIARRMQEGCFPQPYPLPILPPHTKKKTPGETTECGNNEANDNEEAEDRDGAATFRGSSYSPLSAFTFITGLPLPLLPAATFHPFSRSVRCDTYVGASANVCFTCSCICLCPSLRAYFQVAHSYEHLYE